MPRAVRNSLVDLEAVAQVLAQLGKIGSNMNKSRRRLTGGVSGHYGLAMNSADQTQLDSTRLA